MRPWQKMALYFLAVILITASVSIAATIVTMNKQRGDRVVLSSEEFKKYEALLPIWELMEKIRTEHHGEAISDEEMVSNALRGILSNMKDPYTKYYTEAEYIAYLGQMDGAYHGIGALIGQPQEAAPGIFGATVLKIYEKSPAEEAGLLVGDIILSVDGASLLHLNLEETERLFSGEDGSEVTLVVNRQGVEHTFVIQRVSGATPRVGHWLFQQRTGYITIDKFTGSAADEFGEALRDLTDRGMRSLVIDLRNNPGGELEQVVSCVNRLLPDKDIIVSVKFANGKEDVYRSDSRCITVPLAVIVNENSASASEIFAAAIQENDRGAIVGANTYGKGVVQTTMQLKSNSGWVKFTTAAYYTPQGHNVDGKGVMPDADVELAEEFKALPISAINQEDDTQLWVALDIVREEADALATNREATPEDLEGLDPDEEAAA